MEMDMKNVPDSHRDLLDDRIKAFAFLGTTMVDGTPQVTPVWFDTEDDHLRINTARGRVKDQNMSQRPGVALAIVDPQNPYRYLQIRGVITKVTEEGARAHIDRLAKKYRGVDSYSGSLSETRVIYYLQPKNSNTMG
jgi:PPOX class probable F420-dependent enzyme